jgi:hypothetical protein
MLFQYRPSVLDHASNSDKKHSIEACFSVHLFEGVVHRYEDRRQCLFLATRSGHACGGTVFALPHVSDVTPRKSKSYSARLFRWKQVPSEPGLGSPQRTGRSALTQPSAWFGVALRRVLPLVGKDKNHSSTSCRCTTVSIPRAGSAFERLTAFGDTYACPPGPRPPVCKAIRH